MVGFVGGVAYGAAMIRHVTKRGAELRPVIGGLVGSYPGQRACVLREHVLRDELARRLSGITEAVLPYGRADVATDRYVIEVEPARAWRHAVRQVLAYAAQAGLEPGVALFGAASRDVVLKRYLSLRDGRPPVALWWWHEGLGWQRISARTDCRSMA